MISNRSVAALLAVVFVVGLAIGTVAGGALIGDATGARLGGVNSASPPWSYTMTRGCASPHALDAAGWLVETTTHSGTVFVFNETFTGVGGANVTLQSSPETRTYTLVVTTGGGVGVTKPGTPPEECQSATSVQASVTLPRNYATFAVVHNGETIVRVHDTGATTTRVWDLDERNATG